jgi:hypothetical protein
MYPWRNALNSWAAGTHLHIDALGLVTILGTEEIDLSIGRLVRSPYLEFLPLLGAFVIAGDRFTEKRSGFTLYNISGGIMTTEVAGWFSRWLRAQRFRKVRSIVTWEVKRSPTRWTAFFVGFLLVSLPCNGMLVALTLLSEDWWGFANAMAMVVSVVVRVVLVAQNRAGIDRNIQTAEDFIGEYKYEEKCAEHREAVAKFEAALRKNEIDPETEPPEPPKSPRDIAKVIVVTDDSKAVTIKAPEYLISQVFATNPRIPKPRVYLVFRWIGWAAFAVHIVSIGMAALYTQICTVVLLVVATVLTVNKLGCDDSRAWKVVRKIWKKTDGWGKPAEVCWVSSNLGATISTYPEEYADWTEAKREDEAPEVQTVEEMSTPSREGSVQETQEPPRRRRRITVDVESNPGNGGTPKENPKPRKIRERRQDLFVWLNLTEKEERYMTAWGLFPHNDDWYKAYEKKKKTHSKRVGTDKLEKEQGNGKLTGEPESSRVGKIHM